MADEFLKIQRLRKSFGNIEVLKGVDLDLHKGEVLVLLGPSGCGKSTLLRCINGLENINDGVITLDGLGELGKDVS